jgi:hypothetical protein
VTTLSLHEILAQRQGLATGGDMTAVVAAAQMANQHLEEEAMTPYSPSELAEHWEFKIIRSPTGRFRNPLFLKQILDEEARAGWMFLEKFDNERVRLKRPASARAGDARCNFDPYRTSVGFGSGNMAWIGMALALVISLLAAIATFLFVAQSSGR